MNKLVERFEGILHESKDIFRGSYTTDYLVISGAKVRCAEEAKKLAIEFARWLHKTNWYENEELNTSDKLFDKFIDEYYK